MNLRGKTDSEEIFERLLPYVGKGDILPGFREIHGGFRDFTSLNSFLLEPDHLWAVCRHAENPNHYTLTLTETEAGRVVSSEPLGEFAEDRTAVPNGTAIRIVRHTRKIDPHSL